MYTRRLHRTLQLVSMQACNHGKRWTLYFEHLPSSELQHSFAQLECYNGYLACIALVYHYIDTFANRDTVRSPNKVLLVFHT